MRGYHRHRWLLAQKKYERRMKARRHYLKFTDEMKRTVRRFITVERGRCMCGDNLPLDLAGEAPGQRRDGAQPQTSRATEAKT